MTNVSDHSKRAVINLNKFAHDNVAQNYDELHAEIFNPTEQARINNVIKRTLSFVATGTRTKNVLDFGSGTGNLTIHLWKLGAEVMAADVSEKSLMRLKEKVGDSAKISTFPLNGDDLSTIADKTFDMVATYSVLHHIPDYLKITEEFARIVRPGGIIYIDHEVTPSYWEMNETYNAYLEELGGKYLQDHLNELGIGVPQPQVRKGFCNLASHIRMLLGSFRIKDAVVSRQISDYGDIHVFKHDHIEWGEIAARLASCCDVLAQEDYLVCRERAEDPLAWHKWRNKCTDMRFMIFRKRSI